MKWWHKMMAPMQRIWIVVAQRIGVRKTGKDSYISPPISHLWLAHLKFDSLLFDVLNWLVKLRQDVRTCEYDDVHVLWDMLKRNETELASPRTKKRHFWNIYNWARCAPYLRRSF
ncbi:hypothetical protein RHGRI_016394 [Rhododendron griersonianum]|uniref:Uncharacterized protein n=1 Tax=Rhododendron griersonianum TaxID=479676 RepID=A0AAV6JTZ2_9ERIC|nr:hypothetical protein RHGRI_016394 [Rhododendron griersonianum]